MDYEAVLSQLAARFKEPSSWAGLMGLTAMFGLHLDPGLLQTLIYIGAGIAGLVAFFLPEKAAPKA